MHLIEQYAVNCGVKIGRPDIYETFFPVSSERYVSFHPTSKYESKSYDHWQIVIDLILPALKKRGIDIVQIGAKNEKPYIGCLHTQGLTSINQAAYIIKNCIMNFGADSFSAHFASSYNKKIVALYANNNINNCKPYWSAAKDCFLLEPDRGGKKPNYSEKENPKTINSIKPELIANAVLSLLDAEEKISLKTHFIGDKYDPTTKFIEIVPNALVDPKPFGVDTFNIRMDLTFNQEILFRQTQICNVNIITDKAIDIQLLKASKEKIKGVLYVVKENDEPEFVKSIIDLGINIQIATKLSNEQLLPKRINYMDIGLIGSILEKDFKHCVGKKFRSSKYLVSEGKIYPSTAYFRKNMPVPNFDQHSVEFLNEEDDKIETDFFYIFEP